MGLWDQSLFYELWDIDGYEGVNPDADMDVQLKQATCIVRYLALPEPRNWWQRALDEEMSTLHAGLLREKYWQLIKLPQLSKRINYALIMALAFIDDPQKPENRNGEYTLEEYLSAAEQVLAERPDLRRLSKSAMRIAGRPFWEHEALESTYGVFGFQNRLYYADTYGAYVFQLDPFPAAWEKAGPEEKWKRTRKLPLNLRHLQLGRLHQHPLMEMELPHCSLLLWKPTKTEFCYEPDWNDSVPLKEWKEANEIAPILALLNETISADEWAKQKDWSALANEFIKSVRGPLLNRLKQFPTGSWELLEAAYGWDGFEDLMDANPALAACLALRVRVGKRPGVRRKRLDYGSLVRCRQREIAAAIGFGDSESVVSILKKVVPDACTPRELSFLSDLIHDPLSMPHLQDARQISGPAIFLLQDFVLRGRLGGGLITDVSREYPLSDDITSTAEGVKQLRGGTRQREFTNLYLEMRDLARFNPDITMHSIDDFRAKHAAMIKKLNEGTIGNRTVQFPEPPFPGTEHIQPITSTNELALEGKEMHHCVKSYLRDIFKGFVAVYRVTYPERATLSIERSPHAWRLGQLKLQNNEEPDEKTKAFVHDWLKASGVRTGRQGKVKAPRNLTRTEHSTEEASSDKVSLQPEPGKWTEGLVDATHEHFKIYYGDKGKFIALVGRDADDEKSYIVQFLPDAMHPETLKKVQSGLKLELDFYLSQKPEHDRWRYMRYHCGTYANAYSEYHWSYCPVPESAN